MRDVEHQRDMLNLSLYWISDTREKKYRKTKECAQGYLRQDLNTISTLLTLYGKISRTVPKHLKVQIIAIDIKMISVFNLMFTEASSLIFFFFEK